MAAYTNAVGGNLRNHISCVARMAQSTESITHSLEIEVLRNVSQSQTSSTRTNCTPDDSSFIYCNRRKGAELTPKKVRVNGEQKNGCCHSTPLLGSAANNMQLKEYFGRLSIPMVSLRVYRPT